MTEPELDLRELRCERDDRVLFDGLNCRIEAGEVVQVVGPNGAGKTTLLRMLTGITQDYDGRIAWRGVPLREAFYDYKANLCFIGHHPGVKKALTPVENLAFYEALSGGFTQPVSRLLERVGLTGFEQVPCYQLSAGQQRRVALARLYGTSARLWILDEPFTAIDRSGVQALESLLADHLADGGTVVLTTHQALGVAARELDLTAYAGEVA